MSGGGSLDIKYDEVNYILNSALYVLIISYNQRVGGKVRFSGAAAGI